MKVEGEFKIVNDGPRLWPVAAVISLFGTLSALGSALLPSEDLPEPLALPVMAVSTLFFFVSVMTSGVALLELVAGGITNSGSWTLGGWRIRGAVLGLVYVACYVLPWGTIAFWIWFHAFHARF